MHTLRVCLLLITASATAWAGWRADCHHEARICRQQHGTSTTVTTTSSTTSTTAIRHVTIGGVGGNPIDCVLIAGGPYCQHPADQPPDRILSMTTTSCADGSVQTCVALALTPDYIPWPYWFCTPACSP